MTYEVTISALVAFVTALRAAVQRAVQLGQRGVGDSAQRGPERGAGDGTGRRRLQLVRSGGIRRRLDPAGLQPVVVAAHLAAGGAVAGQPFLALSLQAALAIGLVVIALAYLQLGQPETEWQSLLQPFGEALKESEVLDADQADQLIEVLAGWMTGVLAAGMFLQLVFGLLLGRWWQALLYNPGGFRSEFHQLRLYPALAWLALPVTPARPMASLSVSYGATRPIFWKELPPAAGPLWQATQPLFFNNS
mgnify:CR=1 FL=1